MKKIMILILVILLMVSGCKYISKEDKGNQGSSSSSSSKEEKESSKELTVNMKVNKVKSEEIKGSKDAVVDFGLSLLKEVRKDGENALISPLSVFTALSMTANGADGNTLTQMEEVLGLKVQELNDFSHKYLEATRKDDSSLLHIANSLWLKDDIDVQVKEDFLQRNVDYYDSDVFVSAFNDKTKEDINNWVEDYTSGMIKEMLDKIDKDAVMYLINALYFDAEWEEIYPSNKVYLGEFTSSLGDKQEVEFMYSEEGVYLEDDMSTGFIKYYKDRTYAFVALLPKENVTVEDYINGKSGKDIMETLSSGEEDSVRVSIPKFKSEFSSNLKDALIDMGMEDAFFYEMANFGKMAEVSPPYKLVVNKVIHKTFIAVNERGTKAGAASAVEITKEMAMEEQKSVFLDRPFIYMIIDTKEEVPIFIGTVETLQ